MVCMMEGYREKEIAYAISYNMLLSEILSLTIREYRITYNSIDYHIITLNYSLFFFLDQNCAIYLSDCGICFRALPFEPEEERKNYLGLFKKIL